MSKEANPFIDALRDQLARGENAAVLLQEMDTANRIKHLCVLEGALMRDLDTNYLNRVLDEFGGPRTLAGIFKNPRLTQDDVARALSVAAPYMEQLCFELPKGTDLSGWNYFLTELAQHAEPLGWNRQHQLVRSLWERINSAKMEPASYKTRNAIVPGLLRTPGSTREDYDTATRWWNDLNRLSRYERLETKSGNNDPHDRSLMLDMTQADLWSEALLDHPTATLADLQATHRNVIERNPTNQDIAITLFWRHVLNAPRTAKYAWIVEMVLIHDAAGKLHTGDNAAVKFLVSAVRHGHGRAVFASSIPPERLLRTIQQADVETLVAMTSDDWQAGIQHPNGAVRQAAFLAQGRIPATEPAQAPLPIRP